MAQEASPAARQPRTWFITGCSSGFGEILVRKLCAEGDNVIATGRQADVKLAHLQDTGAKIMDLDVSASEDVIRAKVAEAWDLFPGGVDVVVNNAGYVLSGLIEDLTQEQMEQSFRTNFHGPLNISRAFLPFLRKRGTGTLLFLGSQAAWHVDPFAGAYCSSKFALSGS
nr:short-chain oxidoreductase [Colletotrichum truncatum]KAF6798510.1 short-chain oxidoreductase [Colletotrichum truncatum]